MVAFLMSAKLATPGLPLKWNLTKDNIVDRVTMRSDMKSAAKARSPSNKERKVLSQVSKVGGLK